MVLVICFHRRWETRSRDVYIRVRCTLNLDWQLVSYMILHMFQCHSPKSSHPLDAWGWCTGTTQRDGVGREEGGGFRMGSTCIPVVDSFWCLAKLIQCFRFKNKIKFKKKKSEMCLKFLGCGMVVEGWYILQVHAISCVNIKELGFTVSDQLFYREDVM